MPLPVLPAARAVSDADLLRLFCRTERFWAETLGEAVQLESGVGITSPDLPDVGPANRIIDAAIPPGGSAIDVVREVEDHFAAAGVSCKRWTLDPTVGEDRAAPLVAHLTSLGYRFSTEAVMALSADLPGRAQVVPLPLPAGMTVLPARAAFRQARELAVEVHAEASANGQSTDAEQWAEAQVRHLDDPRCDALLVLADGQAVARVSVLSVGDIGRVDQVYVSPVHRRQGVGRAIIGRAMEICSRSSFRHVVLAVDPSRTGAVALYQSFGFRRVGTVSSFESGR